MTEIHPKSLVHKYRRKTSPPGESPQIPNQDQKAQVSQQYRTAYPTTYQFQQPLKSDENIALNAGMDQRIDPISQNDLDDVANTLAYQTIPPLEFLNKEPDLNAAAIFSKIWNNIYSYSGGPYDIFDDKTRLQLCQSALGENFAGDLQLKINAERAFKGVLDFEMALRHRLGTIITFPTTTIL
ncbi:hypothetical protein GcC1_034028 [Golovinomyces cichoracearum]|uniref:Uncharacterized protein n=1 Tax=Golovinomyces cichoracearum TaxID=62708 RepID=A0A420J1E7_9PEZI|nr:hypothetical protein GcC1_034028 [Golovinomyces cichoracearum]